MNRARVVAVVVTYNRLSLLRPLVGRLRGLERVDEVIVVDNASTDGTAGWLAGQPVTTLTLPRNMGGAGGFDAGLAAALRDGADLVWLMDDDGLPEPDCLDLLLAHQGEFDFWGPLVVDQEEPERLVFPIRVPGSTRVLHRVDDAAAATSDGVIRDVVIPFNGVLVTRDLVERIGGIREEYFIWGDDHEYRLRAERAGARIGTVVAARVRHPRVGDLGTPMLAGRTTYNHSPSDLKHYCMARNNLVNLRDYKGWPHALAFVAKTLWFYTLTRPDPRRLRLSLRGMWAGLRGDFTGHRRLLASDGNRPGTRVPLSGPVADQSALRESVAVVVVTYNRADLLERMLDALLVQTRVPDAVFVIDNASSDRTAQVLEQFADRDELPLQVTRQRRNTGGAGGFREGVRQAYLAGFDRLWLMDDDVLPEPHALETLLNVDEDCLMVVREDRHGTLVEKSAVDFDLTNPLAIRPKRASIESRYRDRADMPAKVELHNVAFEGFMVRRSVVQRIGLPESDYFIFYDDVDYALRARRAGYRIWAVRDAVLVRQLDFDQQHALDGWKGFYMYRNLFLVHFRFGRNPLVRAKPYLITAAVTLLSPLRGGSGERDNVIRGLQAAREMTSGTGTRDGGPRSGPTRPTGGSARGSARGRAAR